MEGLVKIIALLAGGYLLLRYLTDRAEASRTPAETYTEPAIVRAPDVRGMVLEKARASGALPQDGLLTFDQWNYFYQIVRGEPGPAIEDAMPGAPRERRITIDEWWAAVSSRVG